MDWFDTFDNIFYLNDKEKVLKFMYSNNLYCEDSKLIMFTPEIDDVEWYTIKDYKN